MTPNTNNSSKSRHLEYGIRQIIDRRAGEEFLCGVLF